VFLRYGMRALQIALGVACLVVVYTGLAPVLRASAVEAAQIPPADVPPERDSSLERYRVIGARNLFRTRSGPVAVAPVTEELKESALQLKLCGTYAAQPADRSVACIDDQSTQKRRAFRVGQELTPGVRLVAVERRRAVIDNRGVQEQISMEDPPMAGAITSGGSSGPRGAPASAANRGTPRISERLRQLRQRNEQPAAPALPAAPSKLQAALDGAQLAPVYDENGGFGGVRLSGINPEGPFVGMPEETVCFEANGVKLDGAQALPTALVSNADGQLCLRCRMPDGSETTRCL
jgi:type II secretory pathway component PulC